jgi:hypothetical protein
MVLDQKWFSEITLQLKTMTLAEKHRSLDHFFNENSHDFNYYFEYLVPAHIDYGTIFYFMECMLTKYISRIKIKHIEYLLSVYGWCDEMNNASRHLSLFFQILSSDGNDETAKQYYDMFVKIIGEYINTLDKNSLFLVYAYIVNNLPKNGQEVLTCLILDRNLATPETIFDNIHCCYHPTKNFIKTIENILEHYGFDIQEHSSKPDFVKRKIIRNSFHTYIDQIEPEISSTVTIEIILDNLRRYCGSDIATSCEKVLLNGLNSGVDINLILLDKIKLMDLILVLTLI